MANLFDLFDKIKSTTPSPQGAVEYLIVGLGNPGSSYVATRHNAGFMAVDVLAARLQVKVQKLKFKSLIGDCTLADKHCVLMKPTTFMNNSGEAVVEAMQFYKLTTEQVIVLYDDISLEPSQLRIRRKGSAGGHNGIKSIIYLTGKDDFPRVKIGVGKKPDPRYDLADWVLSAFTQAEMEQMQGAYRSTADAVELIVRDKMDQAMNQFNS